MMAVDGGVVRAGHEPYIMGFTAPPVAALDNNNYMGFTAPPVAALDNNNYPRELVIIVPRAGTSPSGVVSGASHGSSPSSSPQHTMVTSVPPPRSALLSSSSSSSSSSQHVKTDHRNAAAYAAANAAYDASAVFPARPESLEMFRPPSFLEEDESTIDDEVGVTTAASAALDRRATVRERPGSSNSSGTKHASATATTTETNDTTNAGASDSADVAADQSALDARVAELARDMIEIEASVNRDVDGPARLRVLLEHVGVSIEMFVGNPECGVPAFLARVHDLLDLDPGYCTMLHYTDADGDMAEITDVHPYSALRDALLVARIKDGVVVSAAQTKREVADATARAVRRRARADRITQAKRPPSIRPPSTGSSRSSRPDSVVSILAEDVFPVARVAQQLGLEYLDGTRPVNITTAMNSAIVADIDPNMSVATMLAGRRDVQVGNDPRYSDAHAVDRVKGGCCGCNARFRFAIENSEPDETHTAVVRCPMCTAVNLFVVV
jgi:hypothetical protein